MAFHRRPSMFLRYVLTAFLLALTFHILIGTSRLSAQRDSTSFAAPWRRRHPIDKLIKNAEKEFAYKLARQTSTLHDAADAYRKRRGRHPPPGFDQWHEFAVRHNAVIVEGFWDQIYHDLEPFWGVEPARIRKGAREVDMRIEIRDHRAFTGSDWFWTQIWLEMIQSIEHLLPDMEIALNAMDEPRTVVPWEDIQRYMKQAAKTRTMVNPKKAVSEFTKLPAPVTEVLEEGDGPERIWENEKHYWLIARRGCPPDSAARQANVITNFNQTPAIASTFGLKHMRDGYVSNYTLSTDFCHQADLQALEGVFVEPLSVSATSSLLPIFGGSKLATNNDILLPAPMYWNEEERFTGAEGADVPWDSKPPVAIWRGIATGGRNRPSNWRSFQRHRFVAMNNATQLALAESGADTPLNFALPDKRYRLTAQQHHVNPNPNSNTSASNNSLLSRWLASTTDIALTDLSCPSEDPHCSHTAPYFSLAPSLPMAEQFRRGKLLPDIDGNSFSGRYLGFLRSTGLPVKASLWREWHDSRLVAWKHFVPMDSRFEDWLGIVEYFLGCEVCTGEGGNGVVVEGRDEVAREIALAGREWAEKVLRREDMVVYVLRLLLEYARVVDEERESLGWVGDLVT